MASPQKPWLFRTYAGHSTAQASNALYKHNLANGQTGLSVAFDLPTQTGYDSDHILARGEVGKVGVPVCHLGDMRTLFDGIPLDQMNTSMTINATAPWLLALYIAVAQEQNIPLEQLRGTVQNDIIKEYLSRGTYIFPPEPSLKLISDVAGYCLKHVPKWNPMNVCSYHLQEAGATPQQELAYALATAIGVLDTIKQYHPALDHDQFEEMVGRISFFVNAGIRFVTEVCKMRAFVELWNEICHQRYGVRNPKHRRFRYGVQVNSLGLTEQQPENNVFRILIEMLAVTLSKNARARAVQLPAWNEALGLPRPWDQQWSLRMQQILALETDLLEYDDIFDNNPAINRKVAELKEAALDELSLIEEKGGVVHALEYMKSGLVESHRLRVRSIETGELPVVGVNIFEAGETSPLVSEGSAGSVQQVDPHIEEHQKHQLAAWKANRKQKDVSKAIENLKQAAKDGLNIMPPSLEAVKVGVTTGEWAQALRDVYGQYRAPTGIYITDTPHSLRNDVKEASKKLGRPLTLLVGKPGLDGHSNGAEQIAVCAKDCGMVVVYDGIRMTPEEIVDSASENNVHVIGLSILSGSHINIVQDVMGLLRNKNMGHIPVVVGGIIPENDINALTNCGVKAVYTPKDFRMTHIMQDIISLSLEHKVS